MRQAIASALWCAALGAAGAAQAAVYNLALPGAWPEGRITWTYNPAGRPAGFTDAEIVATVTAAFAAWKQACGIDASYVGLTSTPLDPTPAGSYVVGWSDFGSAAFSARASARSSVTSGGYRPLTGASVRINSHPDAIARLRSRLDTGILVGTAMHEIGHTLGLAHSDDPTSIMFANPYNAADHTTELQGDDITACADLYGGKGVMAKADLRTQPLVPTAYRIQASVLAERPTSAFPTASLAQIDPLDGSTTYFDTHWQGLPAGVTLTRRWISPLGSVYQAGALTVENNTNGSRFSVFPDGGYRFPFAGRWAYHALVDGQLVASVTFDVVRPQVAAVAPFEAAVIGERDAASGNTAWRVAAYGSGAPTTMRLVIDGTAVPTLATWLASGNRRVELWMETNRPRYKPDDGDGQPASSFDAMRRVAATIAASGLPAAAANGTPIQLAESGTLASYSATATVVMPQAGSQGIYVAARVGGALYFRGPGGWGTAAVPLATARGPAMASVDLLRNFDTRWLPAGTQLYVGYGASLDDVTSKGQYQLVRTF